MGVSGRPCAATPDARLATLEQALQTASLPLAEMVPLVAALLSLPVPAHYPPLTLSPQRQKQQTQEALVAWLLAEAAQQPVLAIWEDLHWADPSTLETLHLLLEQVSTARLLVLLTCRPEFHPPWPSRVPVTQITLNRLRRSQVKAMLAHLTGGKALPAALIEQIVAKTDGVPLFVEELVKMILAFGLVQEEAGQYVVRGSVSSLAIPATLHDSLMARLDRLPIGKNLAQLGAVLGREFSYELLQAVASTDEATLQAGLAQLVDAEVLYQRGRPPQAHYIFKHALIQDAAYQSLLKSTQQQYHQHITQVLLERFPDTAETRPELLAQHYTEAGQDEAAIYYWQRAGQRALQGSAHVEASAHLTQGLTVLTTLPETAARRQQELDLQVAPGQALMATKGFGHPEVERTYARARELCQHMGDTPQRFPVLRGLMLYYVNRGDCQTAHQLGEQLLRLARSQPDPALVMFAHYQLGMVLFLWGEPAAAQTHHTQALAAMRLATEQGFALWLAWGTILHGWALAMQGQGEAGLSEIHQGLAAELATGSTLFQAYGLGLLAEAYGEGGHPDEGLSLLAEALAVMDATEVRFYAAELYRLKGALLLRQVIPDASQAEACFHQALDVARRQQAKSLELRAAVSLSRLWRHQGKQAEVYEVLAPIYGWFTEGFDTADLREAKMRLEELE